MQKGGRRADDSVQPERPRPLRYAGLHRLLRGQAHRLRVKRKGSGHGPGGVAVRGVGFIYLDEL